MATCLVERASMGRQSSQAIGLSQWRRGTTDQRSAWFIDTLSQKSAVCLRIAPFADIDEAGADGQSPRGALRPEWLGRLGRSLFADRSVLAPLWCAP